MKKSIPVTLLLASTTGIGIAYIACFAGYADRTATVALMVVSVATMLVAAMILGALRNGRLGRLALPFAAIWVILVAGFILAALLPADTAAAPHLVLGIPRRAAIILYGIGMLPLLGMPLAYAITFEDSTLADADLAALRARAQMILDEEQHIS
jgi:hypothetical protein